MESIPLKYYNQRITEISAEIKEIKKALRSMILFRLIAFTGIIVFWFILSSFSVGLKIGISIAFVVLFFYLIKRNKRIVDQKVFFETKVDILENELLLLNKDSSKNDSGEEYKEPDHAYNYDLDIFGLGSIYQYITRAATSVGKDMLANWLSKPEMSTVELQKRQLAVEELSQKTDWRQEVQSYGLLTDEESGDIEKVISWMKQPSSFKVSLLHKILLYLVPIYSIVITLILSIGVISGQFFALLIVLPLIITGRYLKNTQATYKELDKGFKAVAKFNAIFKKIEEGDFKSERLTEIQKNAAGAHQALKELNSVLGAFDQRLNLLVAIFMNMYLAWDLRCMVNLAEWKTKYSGDTEHWFDSLAQIEALSSFASFRYNHYDETIFPTYNQSGDMIGVGLGHPFLKKENRVDNDFSIQYKNFSIITGANMAGKSTFLRTLGISIVLANAGASVIAKSFELRPIQIFSSMRTSDSLQKNESYFYTELLRLFHLVNRLADGEKLFIILDEILKGTNSKDKAEGSYKFIRKILHLNAMGIIATHDLSLCEIEKEFPDRVSNLFFDVSIKDDDLSFDYKLRNGICSNMNATFLMKKMGITD